MIWRCAAACLLLFSTVVRAQTLEYGPLLARGIDPDTMYFKWGFTATSPATLSYRKVGDTTWKTLGSPDAIDHELKLYGLPLDSAYEYFVKYGATQSPTRTFGTCPTAGQPLDVVVLGDSRDGGSRAKTIMQLVKTEAPDVILETGDIAASGSFDEYLVQFIAIASDVVDTVPFMASPGNHDWLSMLASNYGRLFAVPRDANEAWRSYFYFSCGNTRFLALDSNLVGSTTQLDFVTNQLAAASADPSVEHVLVFFHHSPYSPGPHGDNAAVQNKWVPLFQLASSKVRFVFTGHDHIYARLTNGSAVTYVVTGGAGAPKYTADSATTATNERSQSVYHYVRLHIVGNQISGEAIDSDGVVIDSFAAMGPVGPDMAVPFGADMATPEDLSAVAPLDLATTTSDMAVLPTAKSTGCRIGDHSAEDLVGSWVLVLLVGAAISSRSAARSGASRRR